MLAQLLELAPSGVEEVDVDDDVVEYAVYGAAGELPSLPDVRAAAAGAFVDVSTQEIADDWAERWRSFHRPLVIEGRLTVRPPWEPPGNTPLDIVVDPGQAFGTGAHATTRLCLELMLDAGEPQGAFVDLGCGSGVLAIAAAKLGFAPVNAYDADRGAVAATLDNARDNAVELERVERLDLRSELPPRTDIVVANLMRPLLLCVAERMHDPPRALIVSGLLDHEADEVVAAFAPLGERSRLTSKGWSAVLLVHEI